MPRAAIGATWSPESDATTPIVNHNGKISVAISVFDLLQMWSLLPKQGVINGSLERLEEIWVCSKSEICFHYARAKNFFNLVDKCAEIECDFLGGKTLPGGCEDSTAVTFSNRIRQIIPLFLIRK